MKCENCGEGMKLVVPNNKQGYWECSSCGNVEWEGGDYG